MRKALLLSLLTLVVAVPGFAADDRHQSYLSYDDGGTVVRSADDREIEAHRNLPIYPGDQIVTARRGRAEVRLADGNIIGIDRTTALQFDAILDSYEGEAGETIAVLRYGKVAVHRTDIGRDYVRLDTNFASYVADYEAIYSVETAAGGDRVTVFDGVIEVRLPARTTRLRAGETINVDGSGLYEIVRGQDHAADDFERWFLQRADRFAEFSSKYVDRQMGYWADDLDEHGSWVHVSGIGWSWRPIVSVGWRPYYNGYWHYSRYGSVTWVSYDPWGWGPYHYGRWAYDPGFGWIWVPGTGYSPAWVYWMYGPGYVGWAPAGWWDCYRPYYSWAYDPYRNYGVGRHNFGFYGRVSVNDIDLRPWTFVDSGTLVSTRVDRAALTTDAVKVRLGRSRDGLATMAGGVPKFTREELRDPAEAIRRRGLDGRFTGRESGAPPTDVTPFARRDDSVPGSIRERLGRDRGAAVPGGGSGAVATPPAPLGARGGSVAPIGRGSVAPITPGSVAPTTPTDRRGSSGGTITRQPAEGPRTRTIGGGGERRSGAVDRGAVDRGAAGSERRDPETSAPDQTRDRAVDRGSRQVAPPSTSRTDQPDTSTRSSWRGRPRSDNTTAAPSDRSRTGTRDRVRSDVPRRVIDGIGGARVVPRDSGKTSTTTRSRDRSSSPSRDRSVTRGSSGSTSRSSGGSSTRSSGGSSSSGSSTSSGGSRSSGGGARSSSGGGGGGGGRIKRD